MKVMNSLVGLTMITSLMALGGCGGASDQSAGMAEPVQAPVEAVEMTYPTPEQPTAEQPGTEVETDDHAGHDHPKSDHPQ